MAPKVSHHMHKSFNKKESQSKIKFEEDAVDLASSTRSSSSTEATAESTDVSTIAITPVSEDVAETKSECSSNANSSVHEAPSSGKMSKFSNMRRRISKKGQALAASITAFQASDFHDDDEEDFSIVSGTSSHVSVDAHLGMFQTPCSPQERAGAGCPSAAASGGNHSGIFEKATRRLSLTKVAAMPEEPGTGSKLGKTDKYGFLLDKSSSQHSKQKHGHGLSSVSDAIDNLNRVKKWEHILDQILNESSNAAATNSVPGGFVNTQSKIKYYTRRGLPDAIRQRAWTVLTGVDIIMNDREGEYQDLVAKANQEYEKLSGIVKRRASIELVEEPKGGEEKKGESSADANLSQIVENTYLETIERDIRRTFPKHYLFHDRSEYFDGHNSNDRRSSEPEEEGEEVVVQLDFDSDGEGCDDEDETKASSDSATHNSKEEGSTTQDLPTEEEREKQNQFIVEAKQKLFDGVPVQDETNCEDQKVGDGVSTNPDPEKVSNVPAGQAALRRILRAYTIYDPETGYCQGMNFIAAMFLTFLSEEEAFWLLVVVMNEEPYKLRELFGEDMAGAQEVLYIAEKLIRQFMPKLAQHMDKENVHVSMFVTQWLLTIYTSTFPFDLVARVWDSFLVEGWKVVYRVMLALFEDASKDVMGLQFEQILHYFQEYPQSVDGRRIMSRSLKIALKRKHLQKHVNGYRQTLES